MEDVQSDAPTGFPTILTPQSLPALCRTVWGQNPNQTLGFSRELIHMGQIAVSPRKLHALYDKNMNIVIC